MTYEEEDLLPLSGLQHLVFCERQAALVHVERAWADNGLTVKGSYAHDRVHEVAPRRERRAGRIIVRGLMLHSFELGLAGVADLVEFRTVADSERPEQGGLRRGVRLPGVSGLWAPFPVEYKRGHLKSHRADEVQLCAQAMCIEEMLGAHIAAGALFYGKEHRRVGVTLDSELRTLTREAARRFHELVENSETPPAAKEAKCRSCSLFDLCAPEAMSRRRSARGFLDAEVNRVLRPEGD